MAILDVVGIYSLLVGALYIYIGRVVGRRQVEGDAKGAQFAFLIWWYGLGLSSLMGGLQIGLFRADALSITTYRIVEQANLILVLAALWGLLYYLVYLYTGNKRMFWPLTIFYVLTYGWFAWRAITGTAIEQIINDGWALETIPANDFSAMEGIVVLLALIGPQVGAAIAYFRLYFRLDDPSQKYRVAMVSVAIIVWFGIITIAGLLAAILDSEFNQTGGWNVFSRVLGLAAVLTMLLAYKPPKWIQRKYGVQGV